MKGEARTMETTMTREPIWKLWVDTQRRVVSFHEEAGSQLMEFRAREMFLRCIDGYTAQLYRYQCHEAYQAGMIFRHQRKVIPFFASKSRMIYMKKQQINRKKEEPILFVWGCF